MISELGVPLPALDMTEPRSYMGNLLSGGLGFGLGAALGAKLAAPEREVITTVGDGSYMFGNPLPYHYVGRAENLPTLTIVANNSMWGAVRQSTLDVYPEGTRRQGQRHAADGAAALARLREGGRDLRRLRREGGDRRRGDAGARTRDGARCGRARRRRST